LHPISETGELSTGAIRLTVNGEVKQQADLADLIHPVSELIAFLSRAYRLEPGDLIYTGTPAGVGAVVPGDEIIVSIDGLTDTKVMITPAAHD
ncbi:MAG: fumarylacetoacetate hydrolase family protein, partial [Alphaproteobacteria bacterium]|nr:fumarylacetoacetate hydrolase family protein [Alphaproteobacteria bacterium]